MIRETKAVTSQYTYDAHIHLFATGCRAGILDTMCFFKDFLSRFAILISWTLHRRLRIDIKLFVEETWPSVINNYLFADNSVVGNALENSRIRLIVLTIECVGNSWPLTLIINLSSSESTSIGFLLRSYSLNSLISWSLGTILCRISTLSSDSVFRSRLKTYQHGSSLCHVH